MTKAVPALKIKRLPVLLDKLFLLPHDSDPPLLYFSSFCFAELAFPLKKKSLNTSCLIL